MWLGSAKAIPTCRRSAYRRRAVRRELPAGRPARFWCRTRDAQAGIVARFWRRTRDAQAGIVAGMTMADVATVVTGARVAGMSAPRTRGVAMTPGLHAFIARRLSPGRFGNGSAIMRAALRRLGEREKRLPAHRQAATEAVALDES